MSRSPIDLYVPDLKAGSLPRILCLIFGDEAGGFPFALGEGWRVCRQGMPYLQKPPVGTARCAVRSASLVVEIRERSLRGPRFSDAAAQRPYRGSPA